MIFPENKTLLLASASPRRKQLLEDAGFKIKILPPKKIKEIIPADISANNAAVYLSELKAHAYSEFLNKNTIIITADTTVLLDNTILGKPANENEAFSMLTELSGKEHKVITGVTIQSKNKKISFADITSVKFKKLSEEEIKYYIKNYKPYDKAGSYGIQEWIGYIGITGIKGSYFNVMGLPVQKVYEHLKKF
ncbi:MAG: septum formation protein Maf [Chlorobi bacterium]|nr:septum formation protein Maf [Chlorobiota bacterium]